MFRRKRSTETPSTAPESGASPQNVEGSEGLSESAGTSDAAAGPFSADRLSDTVDRADLGGLLVAPVPGLELRVQVDQASGQVQAVILANAEGAMELQAFAAPRGGDLWSRVRTELAAEATNRGGQAVERDGRFGVELLCQVPVQTPDGVAAIQPQRFVGVNGDRWMLRATLFGRPAVEPDSAQIWEDALALVAVRRGSAAMPVGAMIPVAMPGEQPGEPLAVS